MKTATKYISLKSFLEKNPEKKSIKHVEEIKPQLNIKTRMCRFEEIRKNSCRFGNKCMYAHSLSEIIKKHCFKGENCRNEKCIFSHPKKEKIVEIKKVEFEILPTEFPQVSNGPVDFIKPLINFEQIEWSEECFDTRKEFDCKTSKEIASSISTVNLKIIDTLIFNF